MKCKNCRGAFTPIRDDQKFCKDACRKEFHQYGKMSIAKIAERVERRLCISFGKRIAELEQQVAELKEQAPRWYDRINEH